MCARLTRSPSHVLVCHWLQLCVASLSPSHRSHCTMSSSALHSRALASLRASAPFLPLNVVYKMHDADERSPEDLAYEFERYGKLIRCDIRPFPHLAASIRSLRLRPCLLSSRSEDHHFLSVSSRSTVSPSNGLAVPSCPPALSTRGGSHVDRARRRIRHR